MGKKKINRDSYCYLDVRNEILRQVDAGREITAADIFSAVNFRIGFIHIANKDVMGTVTTAIKDLVKERRIEPCSGFVFRATGILDQIVGAIEKDEG